MWGKLPFLAVLIGIFGVYSGDAFCGGGGMLGHGPSGSGGSGGNGGNSGGLLPPGQSNNSGNSNFTGSCESGWWLAGPGYCTSCPRPTYFKESKQGASKPEDCYHTDGNSKTFYKTITCEPGTFMETGGTTCKDCFEAVGGFNKWCPGGDFSIFSATRLGVYDCPEGFTTTNHENATNLHDCFDHKFGLFDFDYDVHYSECSSGKWYDTQEGLCKSCPSGYNKSTKYTSIRPEDCYKSSNNEHFKGTCSVGYYLPKNKNIENGCTKCLGDYVCPGGTYTSFKQEDQGLYKCAAGYKKSGSACVVDDSNPQNPTPENPYVDDPTPTNCTISGADDNCCKSGQAFQGQGQYYSNGQCKNCPSGFRNIEQNKTSSDSCFTQGAGGVRLYYKKVSCPVGQYLPAGRGWNGQNNGCTACPGDDTVNYCPGITNKLPSLTKDQGLVPCSNNTVPSSDHKTCQNSSGGGNGGDTPPSGSEFDCPAGTYLPAYGNGCQDCTNIHKYCPGGRCKVSSTDQCIYDCPPNAVASSNWKTCDVKLSQVKMKFGPNGTSTKLQDQCWLKTDIKDYVKCEFPNTTPLKKYSYKDYSQPANAVQQEENQK